MQDRNTDDVLAYAPVLDPALVAQIHELNRDYLELMKAHYAAPGRLACVSPLPAAVMESIALLSEGQLSALSRTTYSLYSLGFENVTFWRAATGCVGAVSAQSRYAGGDPSQNLFCEIAMFAAWHSAVSNPVAARVLYGLSDAVLDSFCATPLWLIKRIAADHPRLLQPRWPVNPRFWPDLVRFAAAEDLHRLTAAQLLGNQLLAFELELALRRVNGAGLGARDTGQRLAGARLAKERP